MFIATVLALTGNLQVGLTGHVHSPFAWLEAITPPILVLSTAYVIKEQVLESVEQRHANERAFQAVFADWQAATASPEQHPQWTHFYANALRDALRKTNVRRKEALANMTRADWRAAVCLEMQADQWYEESVPDQTENKNAPVVVDDRRNGHDPKALVAVASGDA